MIDRMKCLHCQHDNRGGAKFCAQCAAPLQRNCLHCGTPLPEAAKFCPECAHTVAAPVSSAGHQTPSRDASERLATAALAGHSPIEGDRRQATVLVADISGYSAMCARLDAENVQNLLGRFYDMTDRVIANYGGHIIDHAGDATLAVFGAPVAHENDGERAARAALDMHAQSAALADTGEGPLRLHVGIASGEVVAATIAAGAQPKYAVTGDAVNLAARLNAFAEAGQTLITDAVYRSVSHIVDARALGDIALKGFDKPVLLWNVDRLRYTTRERRPFVGRQTELHQLMSVLDAVQESGNGLALLVRGDAGIGKSHLVDEVRSRAQNRGYACHKGQVLDFGVRKGEDAISAIVKDMLEVQAPGDQVALRAAVNRGLTSGLLAPDQEVLIGDLLELEQSPEQRAVFNAMDNETRAQRLRELITGMLQRCAVRLPRLLIVEDIHWAAPDLLQDLALLTRAAGEMRVVLLMTSRIEGDPLDKHWRASTQGTSLMTVDVGPLRPEEARILAGGLMEASNRIALNCIERAHGNPLFLEQLLRNAVESGVDKLPATIQSLILARMDRFLPRDKIALQAASIIGQRFALDALRFLADDAEYHCDALIAGDLVRPDGADYVFAHALIQEGVYSSLLNTRKRELHRRAAEWFSDREPVLRAEHLDRAADPTAAQAYLVAAEDQARKFRHEPALRLAERGVELASVDSVRCSLMALRAELLRETGRPAEAITVLKCALELAGDEEQRFRVWMGIAGSNRVTGDIAGAMDALDHAEGIAKRLTLTAEHSRVHHMRGNLFFAAGNGAACRTEHEAALYQAQQAADRECEAQALSGLGDAEYARGRMLTAVEYFRRCVALCEGVGLPRVEIPNRCMIGHCVYYANRLEESTAQMHQCCEEARRMGQTHSEVFAQNSLAMVLAASGDYEQAEAALACGVPLARRAGARRYLSALLYSLAMVSLASGAREAARAHLDEALALAREMGMGFYGPVIVSGLAAIADTHALAKQALEEGEALLREPCVSHCHLFFYRNAIDVSVEWGDWDEARRYADALEEFVRAEPLPWASLVVARARALAMAGAGPHSDALVLELRRIRAEAERVGLRSALPAIDRAVAAI